MLYRLIMINYIYIYYSRLDMYSSWTPLECLWYEIQCIILDCAYPNLRQTVQTARVSLSAPAFLPLGGIPKLPGNHIEFDIVLPLFCTECVWEVSLWLHCSADSQVCKSRWNVHPLEKFESRLSLRTRKNWNIDIDIMFIYIYFI